MEYIILIVLETIFIILKMYYHPIIQRTPRISDIRFMHGAVLIIWIVHWYEEIEIEREMS